MLNTKDNVTDFIRSIASDEEVETQLLLCFSEKPALVTESLFDEIGVFHLLLIQNRPQVISNLLRRDNLQALAKEVKDKNGNSLIHFAARHEAVCVEALACLLFPLKSMAKQLNQSGNTALHEAVKAKNLAKIEALVEAGFFDRKLKNSAGQTVMDLTGGDIRLKKALMPPLNLKKIDPTARLLKVQDSSSSRDHFRYKYPHLMQRDSSGEVTRRLGAKELRVLSRISFEAESSSSSMNFDQIAEKEPGDEFLLGVIKNFIAPFQSSLLSSSGNIDFSPMDLSRKEQRGTENFIKSELSYKSRDTFSSRLVKNSSSIQAFQDAIVSHCEKYLLSQDFSLPQVLLKSEVRLGLTQVLISLHSKANDLYGQYDKKYQESLANFNALFVKNFKLTFLEKVVESDIYRLELAEKEQDYQEDVIYLRLAQILPLSLKELPLFEFESIVKSPAQKLISAKIKLAELGLSFSEIISLALGIEGYELEELDGEKLEVNKSVLYLAIDPSDERLLKYRLFDPAGRINEGEINIQALVELKVLIFPLKIESLKLAARKEILAFVQGEVLKSFESLPELSSSEYLCLIENIFKALVTKKIKPELLLAQTLKGATGEERALLYLWLMIREKTNCSAFIDADLKALSNEIRGLLSQCTMGEVFQALTLLYGQGYFNEPQKILANYLVWQLIIYDWMQNLGLPLTLKKPSEASFLSSASILNFNQNEGLERNSARQGEFLPIASMPPGLFLGLTSDKTVGSSFGPAKKGKEIADGRANKAETYKRFSRLEGFSFPQTFSVKLRRREEARGSLLAESSQEKRAQEMDFFPNLQEFYTINCKRKEGLGKLGKDFNQKIKSFIELNQKYSQLPAVHNFFILNALVNEPHFMAHSQTPSFEARVDALFKAGGDKIDEAYAVARDLDALSLWAYVHFELKEDFYACIWQKKEKMGAFCWHNEYLKQISKLSLFFQEKLLDQPKENLSNAFLALVELIKALTPLREASFHNFDHTIMLMAVLEASGISALLKEEKTKAKKIFKGEMKGKKILAKKILDADAFLNNILLLISPYDNYKAVKDVLSRHPSTLPPLAVSRRDLELAYEPNSPSFGAIGGIFLELMRVRFQILLKLRPFQSDLPLFLKKYQEAKPDALYHRSLCYTHNPKYPGLNLDSCSQDMNFYWLNTRSPSPELLTQCSKASYFLCMHEGKLSRFYFFDAIKESLKKSPDLLLLISLESSAEKMELSEQEKMNELQAIAALFSPVSPENSENIYTSTSSSKIKAKLSKRSLISQPKEVIYSSEGLSKEQGQRIWELTRHREYELKIIKLNQDPLIKGLENEEIEDNTLYLNLAEEKLKVNFKTIHGFIQEYWLSPDELGWDLKLALSSHEKLRLKKRLLDLAVEKGVLSFNMKNSPEALLGTLTTCYLKNNLLPGLTLNGKRYYEPKDCLRKIHDFFKLHLASWYQLLPIGERGAWLSSLFLLLNRTYADLVRVNNESYYPRSLSQEQELCTYEKKLEELKHALERPNSGKGSGLFSPEARRIPPLRFLGAPPVSNCQLNSSKFASTPSGFLPTISPESLIYPSPPQLRRELSPSAKPFASPVSAASTPPDFIPVLSPHRRQTTSLISSSASLFGLNQPQERGCIPESPSCLEAHTIYKSHSIEASSVDPSSSPSSLRSFFWEKGGRQRGRSDPSKVSKFKVAGCENKDNICQTNDLTMEISAPMSQVQREAQLKDGEGLEQFSSVF